MSLNLQIVGYVNTEFRKFYVKVRSSEHTPLNTTVLTSVAMLVTMIPLRGWRENAIRMSTAKSRRVNIATVVSMPTEIPDPTTIITSLKHPLLQYQF
jgi:hypothetical protein